MKPLGAIGEAGLLRLLTGRWPRQSSRLAVGVGDDCAVLHGESAHHSWLLKADAVVEDVHFSPTTSPGLIGRKALARALSDLAAMGGQPVAALVTLGVPPTEEPRRLRAIYAGLERVAKKYGVALAGGETTRARQLWLNISLLGECRGHPPVLRSGAQVGDQLFVTGVLGGSGNGHHLKFTPRLAEGEWLARRKMTTAMMDLSDGLSADVPRLASSSRVSVRLDEAAIPCRPGSDLRAAQNDGEDYELLFTVRPADVARLKKTWPFRTPLHCIGNVRTVEKARPRSSPPAHGFDHFKQP